MIPSALISNKAVKVKITEIDSGPPKQNVAYITCINCIIS